MTIEPGEHEESAHVHGADLRGTIANIGSMFLDREITSITIEIGSMFSIVDIENMEPMHHRVRVMTSVLAWRTFF